MGTKGRRSQEQPRLVWSQAGGVRVPALQFGPSRPAATVLLMPGLGLPRYTFRTARAMSGLGLRVLVLDTLWASEWRRPQARVRPGVEPMGDTAAEWALRAGLDSSPLVVVGHSTGAQSALVAGLALQGRVDALSVVLAGLTIRRAQRTYPALLGGAFPAYRHDSPRELVVLANVARVRLDILRILSSALRDRPEDRVAALRAPLVLTAGERDAFAPREWLLEVAARARASQAARVVTLPGSHNNLFTHPEEFAAVVAGAVQGVGGRGAPMAGPTP
jgi:pimeloyl-ACP methyl ester carboxylesterase